MPESEFDAARRFSAIAQRYCLTVEGHTKADRTTLLTEIYQILPKLIDQAVALPSVRFSDLGDDERQSELTLSRPPKLRMDHDEWSQLYRSLQQTLGDWDIYWMVFDPTKDREAITGSVSDDLADIYRDVREGVVRLQSEASFANEVIWEWRQSYYSHWGQHALNALYTIHSLLGKTVFF